MKISNQGPPRLAQKLLGWLLQDDWDTPLGDFEEYFNHIASRQGLRRARWWYAGQVLRLFPPRLYEKARWNLTLLKSDVTFGLRAIRSQKGYAFINILGLALGLICCFLILQFISSQFRFDRFHEKRDDIYRVVLAHGELDINRETTALLGHGVAPDIAQSIPEIERFARLFPDFYIEGPTVIYRNDTEVRAFVEPDVFYADPDLLQIFSFPLVKGDSATALRIPNTLLITERAAAKYFGEEDPIGQTLEYSSPDLVQGEYTVSGVLQNLPRHSHLQFDMLLPMQDMLQSYEEQLPRHLWDPGFGEGFLTFVELSSGASLDAISKKSTSLLTQRIDVASSSNQKQPDVAFQPLTSLYLDYETKISRVLVGSKRTVQFFSLIALLTLGIALINYVNLSTARVIGRAGEVGVRKSMGARRGQLIRQFVMESALTVTVASMLAICGAVLLVPILNLFTDTQFSVIDTWTNPLFILVIVIVVVLGISLSGLYPAWVMSAFKPARSLKGGLNTTTGGSMLRKGLVVVQFTASIGLIIGSCVVYSQLNYMHEADIGLDTNHVLVVASPFVIADDMDRSTAEALLKNEVQNLSSVRGASYAGSMVGQGFNVNALVSLPDDPSMSPVDAGITGVDHEFAAVYGLEVIAGRPFFADMAAWFSIPQNQPRPVLINETAAQAFGFNSLEEAIGRIVETSSMRYVVHGVLEDFNWSSLHRPREAVLFRYQPHSRYLSVKLQTEDTGEIVQAVEEIYNNLFPGDEFRYHFADIVYENQYRNDVRFARLFGAFAGLSIFIACLGLIGLAAHTASRMQKEIGIRKVLGASAASIVRMISLDFLKLIGVAFALAVPAAWVLAHSWLSGFPYRISVPIWTLLGTGFFTLALGLLAVSFQAIRAATVNPTKSIRNH